MSTQITNLKILNYKSIKSLSLDCERINIFIGKPNAGKSNILEAISLLGIDKTTAKNGYEKFLQSTIRYSVLTHLFNNFNIKNPVQVNADDLLAATLAESTSQGAAFAFRLNASRRLNLNQTDGDDAPLKNNLIDLKLSSTGQILWRSYNPDFSDIYNVKNYRFAGLKEGRSESFSLEPPHGDNFFSVVESHDELRAEIAQFLKPNSLELLLDIENNKIQIVQKNKDTLISFPLQLVPDTFQRYIFHLSAIWSNKQSILLFEEPESHSYAPYIYQLAQHIIDDEGGNQFFITTHNPYLLLPIMESGKDVAVFATWIKDFETNAKRLSQAEVDDVLSYGVDLFLNLDNFIPA